ncbi:Cytoplasmic copper homeostasis protein cutC [Mucinivorans hirudinis]|uniref:PF03932 family protein CutC n=1 Tax=Mucinivorans hirudinis TaxID=1433126 RepID=A0A060R9E3_9BACT|nr:Cytoplasmic copper homeostasis protein cutC [Mucinivorans hirudinis]
MVVEICANSVRSCIEAERGGAVRVELCAAIPEGGTTPSWGEMVVARRAISIDMNVIIRPRAGDFLYSDLEFEAMVADIDAARRAGVNGVVFGCLTAEGDVDIERNRELMAAAEGLSVTFHRAFDVCREPMIALEQIIALGFDRILTSGQEPNAMEGAGLIARLVEQAGDRIIIMPGCGINEGNIAEIKLITGAREFHFSAREPLAGGMIYRNERVSMGGAVVVDEFVRDVTSARRVSSTIVASGRH